MKGCDRNDYLIRCIHAARNAIQECSDGDPYPYIVGSLRGMLEGMAGEFTFPSMFDPPVTEALQSLLDTIEQALSQYREKISQQREELLQQQERFSA
jgi:hypothetical protein